VARESLENLVMRKGTALHQLSQISVWLAMFRVAFLIVILACTAACCGPRDTATSGSRCAFADPVMSTQLALLATVADYYIAHQQWPLTKAQLQEQLDREFEDKSQLSAEEVHDLSTFLDQFTILDFHRHGKNLVFHYHFKIDQKTVDQTVTFRPKPTSDEIMQTATAKDHG
jgi:hypothetical protein